MQFYAPLVVQVLLSPGMQHIPDLDISSSDDVISFYRKRGVGMVIMGSEAPSVEHLAYLGDMQQCKCINLRKMTHDAFISLMFGSTCW